MIRHVDKVFLDTTFCHKSWDDVGGFPSREESIALLLELIEKQGKRHVYIAADSHGQEPILQALHARFQAPVLIQDADHPLVTPESKKVWQSWLGGAVEGMRNVVSADPSAASGAFVFRACMSKGLKNPKSIWNVGAAAADRDEDISKGDGRTRTEGRARRREEKEILRVKASALWFSSSAAGESDERGLLERRGEALAVRLEPAPVKQDSYGVCLYAFAALVCVCRSCMHLPLLYAFAALVCVCRSCVRLPLLCAFAALVCVCCSCMHLPLLYAFGALVCIWRSCMHLPLLCAFAALSQPGSLG